MSLAIATNTMPSWWLAEPDEAIVTALALLEQQAEEMRRRG